MMKNRLYSNTFWICFGVILLCSACNKNKKEKPETSQESIEILPEVVFDVATDDVLDLFIESDGVVYPTQEVVIASRRSGYLEVSNLKDGAVVKKDQTILKLNDFDAKIAKQSSENRLKQAEIEFEDQLLSMGYSKADSAKMSLEKKEYALIRSGYQQAKIDLKKAKQDLKETQWNAPFDGVIYTDKVLAANAYISAGTDLGRLMDLSEVLVRFRVLDDELHQIKKGQRVSLFVNKTETVEGEIISVSPKIDENSKTGIATAKVLNKNNVLSAGQNVSGRIYIKRVEGNARIPRAAVLARGEKLDRYVVFKLNKNEVEWIYVKPVATTNAWAIINEPNINPGDTIAVDRHFTLSHLQKVIPKFN